MNANAPTTARDPTMVPTAMPAMAPLLRPPPDPEPEEDEPVGVTVAAATVSVAVASPESKSAAVTLKQGTWAVKSAASTRVWVLVGRGQPGHDNVKCESSWDEIGNRL